ncbi:MAG: FHA domain-containing protein [Anaerolineae bacterium]|jgi:ABC transport system ATP-binding/permease protein|nr:FHA domain-containing protein [Anaerolineae bacterium]MBT7073308.1 FHA domain-containing protein [Anaerolineae bacterium]MBT7782756.1 FHA domain-containing protein [Anaerolineae bacterium]
MKNNQKGTQLLKHTRLIIRFPDGKEEKLSLIKAVTRIGRAENNDFVIPKTYKSISREHLEIKRKNGQYIISNLSSDNGFFVNGKREEEAKLNNNDDIIIGLAEHGHEIHIRFEMGTEALISAATSSQATQTPFNLLTEEPSGIPYLSIRFPKGQKTFFSINKDQALVGRSPQADLTLPEGYGFVSSRHFELSRKGDSFTITDLESTNGTLLNNQPLLPNIPTDLHNNAIIRIGDESFGISLGITFFNPLESSLPVEGFAIAAPSVMMEAEKVITIGRHAKSDIFLDAPDVSRQHATLLKREQATILSDLESSNGTFVNEQLIQSAELHEGDIIRIGEFLLTFQNGEVTPYQSNGMRMDVGGLSKDVKTQKGKLRILDNINLSVLPREFVAIVGGSGAGKTTLLNALVGIRPGEGEVKLNGHDFYEEYEHFRAQLGYVPQNDILHTMLTVEKALDYTVRLRLPASINADERNRRIETVLETVSMNTETIRKTHIGNLSGGQRKRVSIAAELLADPKLIYLDEATSGLDPGLEKKMMHTLRRMADEGRTVMLITHATDNIVQTDHVAFISQGKLVFFGPSQEALTFFEVDEFADIYEKIERSGEEWRRIFEEQKPEAFQHYVQARKDNAQAMQKRELPKIKFGLGDLLRQFIVLLQRSLNVLFSDPITLLLMLLLLPLTGTLQLIIGSTEILTGNLSILADPVAAAKTMTENYVPFASTNTFVFVMGLEAVLTGLFVPSNDLVKERGIYLRERMVNLKVMPYLLSKAAIYSVFVIIQVALYLLILSFGVNFPTEGLYINGILEIFITLFLTMMAGISFGFIVSAISRNTEMSIYILVILLFFQFFFAGTVFDLRDNAFEPMSYFTTTRWSLTALGVSIDMPTLVESSILCSKVPENPLDPNSRLRNHCKHYPKAKENLMLNYEDDMLFKSWGILFGMSILFLTITGVLLERTKAD